MFETPKAPATEGKAEDAATAAKARRAMPSTFLRRYRAFCYRVLGQRLDERPGQELLAERLKQAGVNLTPGLHRAVLLITTVWATATAFVVSLLLFRVILDESTWYLFVLIITGVTFAAVVSAFQFMVGSRITNRRGHLERELPFTLSELSVLASTGMAPIELVRHMARRTHDPAMTGEFRKIVYKTDIQGKDLISALAETAKESPSLTLREAFWDLANMIHQGGNLDEYLRAKSEDVLKLKRASQKEFIERLTAYLDMYVSLVLVGVLMLAVGAFLINSFGSTVGGLDANELLLVLAYGIVPLAVIMTTVLISVAYARAD